jgi:ribonuclease P protein component
VSRHTDHDFPKSVRLLAAEDFRSVFRKGHRTQTPYFTIIHIHNSKGRARLGLAVAKKNLQRAVDRNRVKRIIREWFRLQQDQLASVDIIVQAKMVTSEAGNKELIQSLNETISRLAVR